MKNVLTFTAMAEIATGIALFVVPSLVGQLLLGEQLAGVAALLAQVAGIALVALGVACWPGPALVGMLTYSVAVAVFLAYAGHSGSAGILLWPAVVLHTILSVLLAFAWIIGRRGPHEPEVKGNELK